MAIAISPPEQRILLDNITWETYESLLRRHLLPALGYVPLVSLGPEHLRALYDRLLPSISPGTVRLLHHGAGFGREHALLRQVIPLARRRGPVARPARMVWR